MAWYAVISWITTKGEKIKKVIPATDIKEEDSLAITIQKVKHQAEMLSLSMAGRLPKGTKVYYRIGWEGRRHTVTSDSKLGRFQTTQIQTDAEMKTLSDLIKKIFRGPGFVFVGHFEEKGVKKQVIITVNPFGIQILDKPAPPKNKQ